MSDLLLQALEILKPLQAPEISPISPQGNHEGKSQTIEFNGISPVSPISPRNHDRPLENAISGRGSERPEREQVARHIPSFGREIGEIGEKSEKSVGYADRARGNEGKIKGNPDISTGYVKRSPSEWRAFYDARVAARLPEAGGALARDLAFLDCFDLIPKSIWPADRVDLLVKAGIPKPATWFVGTPRNPAKGETA